FKNAVQRVCRDLRIASGRHLVWKPPGRIGLGLPGQGGTLSGDAVVADVEAEAKKTDNRAKLGRSDASTRHLVVIFGEHNGVGRSSMIGGFFPERAASLPPEVTVAWAVSPLHGATDE